jgi:single-strand DNA-binding protein|tara:strand:+ start:508 stop:945 length:438 start_codon:yes stop_codon:yes gene_type:complete
MAKGINKAILIGNLGHDPELRETKSGMSVVNFSLAVTERRKTGDEYADHTEWFRVAAFGRTADACAQYLSKGSSVYVDGRMQTREWVDKEGVTRKTTEILANDITFLSTKDASREQAPAKTAPAAVGYGQQASNKPNVYDNEGPW